MKFKVIELLTQLKIGLWGSWYSNRAARTQGFNAKIGFEKYAPSPEILAKMCQILLVWFARPILDTFLVISWDPMYIFQNQTVSPSRSIWIPWTSYSEQFFFSLIKGSEPFCRPFPHRKMAQIWLFESGSLFSIYIYRFSDYGQYQFQIFVYFTTP